MKRFAFFAGLALAASGCHKEPPAPVPFEPTGPTLTVAYTGDGHGEIAPCG